ncbi:MAG: nuclear transport factor 2 family protein [Solirubrobacteraceae bacterium]
MSDYATASGNAGEPGRREQIVRAIFAAFERRDVEAGLRLLAPQIVLEAISGAVLRGEPYVGHDGIRRYFDDVQTHWRELVLEPVNIRAAGRAVVALGRVRGRAAGGSLEPAPTTWVFRFDGELVARIQIFSDPELARRALDAEQLDT